MGSKSELIGRLEVARETLRTALEDIDVEQEVSPGWTASKVLAHISGWDEYAILWFRAVAAGDTAYEPPWRGSDAHNAEFVAEREGFSYEEMVRDCERCRERLKSTISAMPPEALDEPLSYPWGGSGTVADFAVILAEHDKEHAVEIEVAKTQASNA
jgi:hypothetical protein